MSDVLWGQAPSKPQEETTAPAEKRPRPRKMTLFTWALRLVCLGLVAWAAGFIVYKLAASFGATLPALATSIVVYVILSRGTVVTQNSH